MKKQVQKDLSEEREGLFISIADMIEEEFSMLYALIDSDKGQDTIREIQKKIEEKIRTDIKNFSETPDYKAVGEDDDALESVLDACMYPGETVLKQMSGQLEYNGYRVIKCQSLAAEIFMDGVIEKIERNPYAPTASMLFQ